MTRPASPAVRRTVSTVVFLLGALYTSLVLWVTLRPLPWATEGSEAPWGILNPAAWTDEAAWTDGRSLEILLNVLMFVPIGVATGLLLRGVLALALPLLLTLGIELAQIPLDRISHPRDLVANGLGAIVGVALAAVIRRHPAWPGRARRQSNVSVQDAMSTP
ncbi:VanZ family protein [Microbacterium sp. ET2]|uniref:VanZ family protein n=1 Tax=Microbacterium albipurpureum TaxID=3050384 RepID=UPI00259C933C|nr:VanZ family protein [Microbacterium sp. ET2 (Ac-2212)]WJL94252.1 VanZ family protein [Microbacterium sp. ET2 (Ac-2212)]